MTKSKKTIFIILGAVVIVALLAVAVFLFLGPNAIPETPATDLGYALVEGDHIAIWEYTGEEDAIRIPEKIENFPVTEIEYEAFKGNTQLKKVILPQTLEQLSTEAFADSALEEVTIPKSVTNWGMSCFLNTTSLVSVKLEDGLQEIGYAAFMGATSLETISIPDSVTKIGAWAFSACENLNDLKLGDGIKEIESGAFYKCTSLKKVVLPKNLEILASNTFEECTSLEEVTLPETLTTLEMGVFAKASALKSITLPDGLKEIDEYALYGTALETVTIPASVEKIGDCAFDGCTALKSVTFLGDAPTVEGTNEQDEPNKNTFGEPNKELTIYYDPDTDGWDTTVLKDWYTLVAK